MEDYTIVIDGKEYRLVSVNDPIIHYQVRRYHGPDCRDEGPVAIFTTYAEAKKLANEQYCYDEQTGRVVPIIAGKRRRNGKIFKTIKEYYDNYK